MVDSTAAKDLYLEERRQEILQRVEQVGRASVSELSQKLGVSEVTIRTGFAGASGTKAYYSDPWGGHSGRGWTV